MNEDEKKPPVGGVLCGVVNYALLRSRNKVRSRLLDVRSQLDMAVFVAGSAGLRPCADEIQRFIDADLDTLFRRALSLLEEAPASPSRSRSAAG
jgi:hypothetical protein